jgi:thiol-disulfide isomerase/thioredoxin
MSGPKLTRGGYILIAVVVVALIYIYFNYNIKLEGFAQRGVIEPPSATPVGTFTMYYADWCGHCQRVKPVFQELVSQSPILVGGRTITIAMVSPEKEPEKAADVEIQGFPTFIYKDAAGNSKPYNGDRSMDGFMEFLKTQAKAA